MNLKSSGRGLVVKSCYMQKKKNALFVIFVWITLKGIVFLHSLDTFSISKTTKRIAVNKIEIEIEIKIKIIFLFYCKIEIKIDKEKRCSSFSRNPFW